jgi:hypothetical protein
MNVVGTEVPVSLTAVWQVRWPMKTSNSRKKICQFGWLAIVSLSATISTPIAQCQAFDTAMICAWQRTFHTYNYVQSPLRAYNMPRQPNWDGWGGQSFRPTDCEAPATYDSPGFERLGRIPNDLGGALGSAAVGPTVPMGGTPGR